MFRVCMGVWVEEKVAYVGRWGGWGLLWTVGAHKAAWRLGWVGGWVVGWCWERVGGWLGGGGTCGWVCVEGGEEKGSFE